MTIEFIDNIIEDLNGMVLTLHEIRRVFASDVNQPLVIGCFRNVSNIPTKIPRRVHSSQQLEPCVQ